jgi:hypothetical protein
MRPIPAFSNVGDFLTVTSTSQSLLRGIWGKDTAFGVHINDN